MPKAPKKPKAGRPPAKVKRPKLTKEWYDRSVESFKDVKDAVKKLNVHQDPRSKQAARYRHMLDNPQRMPKASPHVDRDMYSPVKSSSTKFRKGGTAKKKKPSPRSHGPRPTPTFDRHPPKKTGPRFIDNRPGAGRPGARAPKKSGPHDRHPPKRRGRMGPAAGRPKKRPIPMTKS